MKLEISEKAAKELWDENPDLRSSYNNNFQVFFETYACYKEWRANSHLQQEFGGNFKLFLTYKRHEAAGDLSITG